MLTERQIQILEFIVNNFIETGAPVGSRTISKASLINVSPATIRNEMADLEDLGFIRQPHVSSGRIPSILGLRYHINQIQESLEDSHESVEMMQELMSVNKKTANDVLEEAVKCLSQATNMTAIITGPRFNQHRLFNSRLIRISAKKVLFVLVSDKEEIRSQTLDVGGYSQEELDALSLILVDRFFGRTIDEMDLHEIYRLSRSYPRYQEFFEYFIPFLKDLLIQLNEEEVYVAGREFLLKNDLKSSKENTSELIAFLKDKTAVKKLLEHRDERVQVKIGTEIGEPLLDNYSIVSGRYHYGSNQSAGLALIGPIRMNYQQAMDMIRATQETLNSLFTGIHL